LLEWRDGDDGGGEGHEPKLTRTAGKVKAFRPCQAQRSPDALK
jgi:hypothetical protein